MLGLRAWAGKGYMEATARVRADSGREGYVEVKLWAGRLRGCYGEGYGGGYGRVTGEEFTGEGDLTAPNIN